MSDQQAFEQLKSFFEGRPACRIAADPLRKNVEIGVVINDNLECAFFKNSDGPRFEKRPAKKPDVVFYLSPEAVESLVNEPSDDIAELGINIAKSYLAGTVRIKVPGNILGLLTHGYLGILKTGGPSFGKFLASHGVSSLGKIKDVFHKMRNS